MNRLLWNLSVIFSDKFRTRLFGMQFSQGGFKMNQAALSIEIDKITTLPFQLCNLAYSSASD